MQGAMAAERQSQSQGSHLDDCSPAWLEHPSNGCKVGLQVLLPHRLDHFATDNLVKGAGTGTIPGIVTNTRVICKNRTHTGES